MSAPKFTPGPWQWEVTPGGEGRLSTPDPGKLYVMGFARQGMRGAQPRFSLWGEVDRGRRGGIMHDFIAAGGSEHPDARLIAAAPELYGSLEELANAADESLSCDHNELCPFAQRLRDAGIKARAELAKAVQP